MNLGLAIFLSSLILGLIWLYVNTKDRWNWKLIWKRALKYSLILILLLVVTTGVIQLVKYIQSKNSEPLTDAQIRYRIEKRFRDTEDFIPTKVTRFWDVSLGAEKKDVIWNRGNPKVKKNKNLWLYTWGQKKINARDYSYYNAKANLFFDENKIIAVLMFYEDFARLHAAELLGINWYREDSESVFRELGEPDKTITYNNELNRLYIYSRYNIVIFLKVNSVYGYGMYNPEHSDYLLERFITF